MRDGTAPWNAPAAPFAADLPATLERGILYRLQPGLELIRDRFDEPRPDDGGLLLSRRPLMGIRLNGRGFALLKAIAAGGRTAAAAADATGVSPSEAAAFLDGLARRRLLQRRPPQPDAWPKVSIIVAARNRHAATRACVASLLALDYPQSSLEILVVDDASEPPLAAALDGLPIDLLRLDRNAGQSVARNLAAARAGGALLAFIDNDCLADRGWLRSLVPWLQDPCQVIVGGRVTAPPPTTPIAVFEAIRSPLDMGSAAAAVGPAETIAYLPSCNLVIRRDAFLAVGGFTAEMRLGEDVDLTWRVLARGGTAFYAPEGRVTHHHRERLKPWLFRRLDYGSSEADLQRRHPVGRRLMPLPRLGLLLLAALAALPVAWPVAAALAAGATALFAGETACKHRQLRRLGAATPIAAVVTAVMREHAASLHSLSATVIRYYGVPLLSLAAIFPVLLPAIAVLALLAPAYDHRRLHPACGPLTFIALYWLEMVAYQTGVWRGCFRWRTFRPLLPRLRWRR